MPTIVWKGGGAYITAGVNTALVEQPDSPAYSLGDTPKCVRKYRGLHSLCLSSRPYLNTVGSGDMAGWIVKQVDINRLPKQVGELIVTYGASPGGGAGDPVGSGGAGLVLPPDEFGLVPFEINPRIEQHPFFATLTPYDQAMVRNWVDAPSADDRKKNLNLISKGDSIAIPPTAAASNPTLATNLGNKLLAGRDSYYLAGWTYTWTHYLFDSPSSFSFGGTLETPGGPLASFLAGNPHVKWLRQSDSMDPGTYPYKITKTWLGGPDGHWDTDLYT